AIDLCQEIAGRELDWTYSEQNRRGDHIWWISSLQKFQEHYPNWKLEYDVPAILSEIYTINEEHWQKEAL
ncbi:MAG: NAD-dependent epimerase, partial [Anaerolineae bacterium]